MPSFCGGVLITWTDEGGSDKETASCKAFSRCNYWSITSSQRLLARGQLGALGQQWRSHSALAAVTLCMSHWHATLIYYTIPALENSNKFFKVVLWLALLMFPFTPPLLLLIASSSPPKHSDSSSPHSVLWTLQHLQYPAHRTGWEHPKCIKILHSLTRGTAWLASCMPQPYSLHCYWTQNPGSWGSLFSAQAQEEPQVNMNALCLLLPTLENRSLTGLS